MNVFEQDKYSTKNTIIIFVAAVIFLIITSVLTYKEIIELKKSYTWVKHTFEVENQIRKVSNKFNEYYIYKLEGITRDSIFEGAISIGLIKKQKAYLEDVVSLTVDNTFQQQNAAELSLLTNEFYNTTTALSEQLEIENVKRIYEKLQFIIQKMLEEEQMLLLKRQDDFEAKSQKIFLLLLIVILFSIIIFILSFVRVNRNRQKLKATQDFVSKLLVCTDNIISYFSPVYNQKNQLIDFEVVFTTEDIKDVIGKNFSKIKGKLISEVYPTLFTNGVFDILKESVKNPGKLYSYTRKFNFIGEEIWFDSSVVELDGGIVINSKNITDLKSSEQKAKSLNNKLVEQNEVLKLSNNELESFSRIASHDLQEPLRKIQMFISRLFDSEYETLSEKGKTYLSKTEDASKRMQNLIKYLLAYSRINQNEIALSSITLAEVVGDVVDEFSEALNEAGGKIEFKNLPTIQGVPFQLNQLFSNIISNSIKYKSATRPLEIVVNCTIVDSSTVPTDSEAKMNATYYCVEIADNGIGFDKKYIAQIFEIFQRLHLKDEYSGYGIGLSICKKIMHFHRGYIAASGAVDKGAKFRLYFPIE